MNETTESLSTVSAIDVFKYAQRNLAENEGRVGAPDGGSDWARIAQGSFADTALVLDQTRNPELRELAAKLLRVAGVALYLEEERVLLEAQLEAEAEAERKQTPSAVVLQMPSPRMRRIVERDAEGNMTAVVDEPAEERGSGAPGGGTPGTPNPGYRNLDSGAR